MSLCLSIYKVRSISSDCLNFYQSLQSPLHLHPIEAATSYHALRSKSEDPTVHQKEIKSREKITPAGTTVSRGPCADHPQRWQVLHIFIDQSYTMASHDDGDCMCQPSTKHSCADWTLEEIVPFASQSTSSRP